MTSKHWTLVGGAVACLKAFFIAGLLGGVSLISVRVSAGELAFPGYSGYLNVPSATVLGHGEAARFPLPLLRPWGTPTSLMVYGPGVIGLWRSEYWGAAFTRRN